MKRIRDDRLWLRVEKYLPYFQNSYEKIKTAKNSDIAYAEIENLYLFMKAITPDFFKGHQIQGGYNYLKSRLLDCELLLPNEFLIDVNPNYEYGMMSERIPTSECIEYKLNWIVYKTRKYLQTKNSLTDRKLVDFNKLTLDNECENASKKVAELSKMLGLECQIIKLYPGYSKNPELFEGNGFHFICIINYDNEKYIIDPTYRQYFTLLQNNLERLGIVDFSGCRPGIFMTTNYYRQKLAKTILKNGWFIVTDGNLKNYFDGFTISYRNGLYYQVTQDYSYTTSYSANDYINFLNGLDKQANYEDEELLGFQRTLTPIKKLK
ncbi:MAG: hypothetical protein IJN03_01295 [Bacilli bacterium]|nr:hypothetical protein [Bacilli bacterium]